MTTAAGVWRGPVEVLIDSPGREATLRGVLGVRTVPEVRAQLQRLLSTGDGDLVLHLADTEISDATGLGVLVGLHQRARRSGRRLVIAEASERLERLFRLTKLHLVLTRLDSTSSLSGYQGLPGILPPPIPPSVMR